MKSCFTILLVSVVVFPMTSATALDLQEVRQLYFKGGENYEKAKKLNNNLDSATYQSPIFQAYDGMATLLMSYHSYNPVQKFQYFKEGRNQLEAAIQRDSMNVELHFLRFTVQTNAPLLLGYYEDIKHDKTLILSKFNEVTSPYLLQKMINFLRESEYLTSEEKNQLNKQHL